jgi:hypothetical protein
MSLLAGVGILIAVNAATIAAMLLVRRGAPEGSRFADGEWCSSTRPRSSCHRRFAPA